MVRETGKMPVPGAFVVTLVLIVICLIVGLLIGAVGIGGVLLVPALTLVTDLDVHQAVPVCTLSYLATAIIGIIIFARHGSIEWIKVLWLSLGAIPAAFLGSISLLSIPAIIVMLLIAALMIGSGLDALLKTRRDRLFNECMFTFINRINADVKMCWSSTDDIHCIRCFYQ